LNNSVFSGTNEMSAEAMARLPLHQCRATFCCTRSIWKATNPAQAATKC